MPNLNQANVPLPAAPAKLTPPVQPEVARIPTACLVSGMSRSAIYREAGRGNIVLLKIGRATLVDMASVRAYLAGLPRAEIRRPREGA